MIFSIVILILIGAIAFFHYVQGFFSAMISMILAILAAVLAVGYHENVAQLAFSSFGVSQGCSISLVGLFVVIYLVLRVAFDKLVPGNIQLPVLADKIGAGLCGVVAGIFATGVLAVAAQALPFGPSVAGYSRYPLADRQVTGFRVPGKTQLQDGQAFDELTEQTLDPAKAGSLMIPADDMLLGAVSQLSSGSLAGDRPFSAIHPSYLDELFGQRLGIQSGANRVMIDMGNDSGIRVEKVVALARGESRYRDGGTDFEIPAIRGKADGKSRLDLSDSSLPPGDFLIVRVKPDAKQADKDGLLRLSCGAVRLSANGQNYHPIGTLSADQKLLRNLPDDPLFVPSGQSVDFVFVVEARDLSDDHQRQLYAPNAKLAPDAFIEVKRQARASLANIAIDKEVTPAENIGVLEKEAVAN